MYIQAQAQINHISAKQLLDEFEGKANEEELQAMVLYGKGNKHVLSELRKHGTEAERDALNKLPDYLFFTQFKNYYSSNNERVEAINSWVNANVNSKEDMIKCKTSLQQIIEHRLLDEKSSKEVVASYVAKISALSEELGTPYSPSDILSDKNPNDFSQCGCKLANRYIDEFFVKDSVRYSSNQNKRHKKHISKIANQTLQERAM